jgi:hypothetical protein
MRVLRELGPERFVQAQARYAGSARDLERDRRIEHYGSAFLYNLFLINDV